MKNRLEEMMGVEFREAATAIPPGIISGNVKVISNVVESFEKRMRDKSALFLGIRRGRGRFTYEFRNVVPKKITIALSCFIL